MLPLLLLTTSFPVLVLVLLRALVYHILSGLQLAIPVLQPVVLSASSICSLALFSSS